MSKILVIENDESLQTILEYDLVQYNYNVEISDNGNEGIKLLEANNYDLVIIDNELPDLSGVEIIEKIRKLNNKIKIILLSSDDDEMAIVFALEIGANDYVIKPFSSRVLSARIRVLLRDLEDVKQNETIVQISERIKIDYLKMQVLLDNENVNLSKLEYDLFTYLVKNKNIVVSREEIMENVWDYNYENKNRIVDVYIHSLKKKLDINEEIENKRGIGYIFIG